MKIFLIGFMGSGKTTVGRKLASKLNLQFYDLDKFIESSYNKSISDIFETEGEESFRKMEHSQLSEIIESDNFILSTGGGTPCFFNNMEIINTSGISVYLQMTPHSLFTRIVESKTRRPLIEKLNDKQLEEFIKQKLLEREPFYKKAHITYSGFNVDINKLTSEILYHKQ